jgi:hypothetical protein
MEVNMDLTILRIIETNSKVFVDVNFTDAELGVLPFGHWLTSAEQLLYATDQNCLAAIINNYADTVRTNKVYELEHPEEFLVEDPE